MIDKINFIFIKLLTEGLKCYYISRFNVDRNSFIYIEDLELVFIIYFLCKYFYVRLEREGGL